MAGDEGRTEAVEEEDKIRLVARLSADYMLRSLKMIGELQDHRREDDVDQDDY